MLFVETAWSSIKLHNVFSNESLAALRKDRLAHIYSEEMPLFT
jgi:hypothetical protein